MRDRKFDLHNGRIGAALTVRVSLKAGKNRVTGLLPNGTIKVNIVDSSSDDEVNQALIKLLSELLGISEAKIEVVAGESGRDKLISVLDIDAGSVQKRLLAGID